MANHPSAIKRIRQTERRTLVNRRNRSRLRTQVKKLMQALESGETETAKNLLRPTISLIDKSVQKGVVTKNRAARLKSRFSLQLNSLSRPQAEG